VGIAGSAYLYQEHSRRQILVIPGIAQTKGSADPGSLPLQLDIQLQSQCHIFLPLGVLLPGIPRSQYQHQLGGPASVYLGSRSQLTAVFILDGIPLYFQESSKRISEQRLFDWEFGWETKKADEFMPVTDGMDEIPW